MTTPKHQETQPQKVPCSTCHKEIPRDAAIVPEGADYVCYFCGVECYEEFAAQKNGGTRKQHQK